MRRYGPTPGPRWSFDRLAELCRHVSTKDGTSHIGDVGRVVLATGYNRSAVHRWQRHGLSTNQADQAAIALELHPCEIWPDWFDREVAA